MRREDLARLFSRARDLCGESEYVVLGSLAVLGWAGEVPARMAASVDVDAYGRSDPGRVFGLARELGQGSRFEAEHGYYLDPVSPRVATLAAGWESRLVRIALPAAGPRPAPRTAGRRGDAQADGTDATASSSERAGATTPQVELVAWFLEVHDAAVSKYARLEPRDREWIRPGLSAGILSLALVGHRFEQTAFADGAEALRARRALEEDRAWLAGRKARRRS